MFYENVSELWELSVRRNPGKTALIFGEDRYTYAEADRRINRIGDWFQQQLVVAIGQYVEIHSGQISHPHYRIFTTERKWAQRVYTHHCPSSAPTTHCRR